MVAGFLPAADLAIDASGSQAMADGRAEQEVVDAQACVAAKGVAGCFQRAYRAVLRNKEAATHTTARATPHPYPPPQGGRVRQ